MRPGVRVGWWLGWRPLYAVVGGATVGLLAGNVVVTWAVRAAMLRGGVGSVAGPLREALTGGAYLLALAVIPVAASVAVGAVVGATAWLAGVLTVNRHADAVRDRAFADGAETTDDPTGGHLLRGVVDAGSPRLVAPPRALEVTRVRPGADAVSVTTRRLSFPDRRVETVRTASVANADLRAVTYDAADRTLRFRGPSDVAVAAGDRPDAVLAALRDRLPGSVAVAGDAGGSGAA